MTDLRCRVLVVEDDAPLRATTVEVLRERFYALEAADGRAALRILERAPIDVLCTDFLMPDMNGLELIRQARARGHQFAAVVLTGVRGKLENHHRRGEAGPSFLVLFKPYTPERLLEIVAQAAAAPPDPHEGHT